MSARNHSVIVRPQTGRSNSELARLLAPLAGVDANALAQALAQGPTTLESELTLADAEALLERLQSMGITASLQSSDAEVKREPAGNGAQSGGGETAPADTTAGWGALFPDLDPSSEASDPEVAPPALKPSRVATATPPATRDAWAGVVGDVEDDDARPPGRPVDEDEHRPMPLDVLESAPAPPVRDSDVITAETDRPQVTRPVEPMRPTNASPTPAKASAPQQPKSQGFNAAKMAGLIAPTEADKPPFAPTGFDERPPHSPELAAILSVVAPGAGQVFNGDDDRALRFGMTFWLIKPWYDAVKDAFEHGKRIRSYHAPRPPDGAGLRTLKYSVGWWISASLAFALITWTAGKGAEMWLREPEPDRSAERIAAAFEQVGTQVLGARVAALDAVQEATRTADVPARFTMSDEERSERLFAIGYEECYAHNFAMCETMMKRVLSLKPANGAAIKLQAWASFQRTSKTRNPMPEVGKVKTLTQYELDKMRDEMAVAGEALPPPRKARAPAPSADAGSTAPSAPTTDAGVQEAGR